MYLSGFPYPPDSIFGPGFGFGGHDDLVAVDSGIRPYRYARRHLVETHFPILQQHILFHGSIDLRILAMDLQSDLIFPHVPLENIIMCLRNLFGLMRKNSMEGLSTGVFRTLERYLDIDLWEPRRNGGIRRCRDHFRVLAPFARRTDSTTLASALARFFRGQSHDITRRERDIYLKDWTTAILEIRDLLSPPDFHQCMNHLYPKRSKMLTAYRRSGLHDPRLDMMFNLMLSFMNERNLDYNYDMGRGRNKYLMPDPYLMPRAKTVPPHMRLMDYPRRHPHIHLEPVLLPPPSPRMLMPALPSPSPSINLALADSYMPGGFGDDIQDLTMNQNMINQQLNDLQHDVAMQNQDLMRLES